MAHRVLATPMALLFLCVLSWMLGTGCERLKRRGPAAAQEPDARPASGDRDRAAKGATPEPRPGVTAGDAGAAHKDARALPTLDAASSHEGDTSPGEPSTAGLSGETRALVKDLGGEVRIRLFASQRLGSRLEPSRQRLLTLLAAYQAASGGRVAHEVIHPDASSEKRAQADAAGVPEILAPQETGGAGEPLPVHFGLTLTGGAPGSTPTRVLRIPVLTPESEPLWELLLSERIRALVTGPPRVALVTGHSELTQHAQEILVKTLESLFPTHGFVTHDITGSTTLPADVRVLLVLPPAVPWTEPARRRLNAFIMQGKAVLFLLEGMKAQATSTSLGVAGPAAYAAADHGLGDLLGAWGITLEGRVVLDEPQGPLSPPLPPGQAWAGATPHPLLITAEVEAFGGASAAVLMASPITLRTAPAASEASPAAASPYTRRPLMTTSARAWTLVGPYVPNLQRPDRPPPETPRGRQVLGALIDGRLPSAFPSEGPKESTAPTRVAVIGDSDILTRLHAVAHNPWILANLFDWLARDESLIGLRSRQAKAAGRVAPAP